MRECVVDMLPLIVLFITKSYFYAYLYIYWLSIVNNYMLKTEMKCLP